MTSTETDKKVISAADLLTAAAKPDVPKENKEIKDVKPEETKAKKSSPKDKKDQGKEKKKVGKKEKLLIAIDDIHAYIDKKLAPFAGIKSTPDKGKNLSNWHVYTTENRAKAKEEVKRLIDANEIDEKSGEIWKKGVGSETRILGKWWAEVPEKDKETIWQAKADALNAERATKQASEGGSVSTGTKRKREESEQADDEPAAKKPKKEKKEKKEKAKKEKKEPKKPRKSKKEKVEAEEEDDEPVDDDTKDMIDAAIKQVTGGAGKKAKGKGKSKAKTAAELKNEPGFDVSSDEE